MPSIECPQCHTPTANALGKTYCPQCGWNREAAEKQTRLLLRLLPLLVIIFDAPLIVWIFIGHAELAVLAALGALALVPAILVVLVVRAKNRIGSAGSLGAQPPQPASPVSSQPGTESINAPNEEIAKQNRVLAELQSPRPVRMSRQGKFAVTMISVALMAFAGALVAMASLQSPAGGHDSGLQNTSTPSRPVVVALALGFLVVMVFLMRRSLARQRRLLELGDLAMARVTRQWTGRNGNGIRYEFTMPDGQNFSRMTTDYSRQLLVGMNVPIFYDRQQPKKQLALCGAFYEVILPGEK